MESTAQRSREGHGARSVRRGRPAVRVRVDLAEITPGPELAGVLAGIELSTLCATDVVEVLQARYRQVNHERAALMAAMVETGLADLGPDHEVHRVSEPGQFAADEIRAALVLSRTAAELAFALGYDLMTRLPQVHAAMLAGRCDEPRARIFSDWTAELDDEAARELCAALLPRVDQLTAGQLVEAIKSRAIAIDPGWAHRRYEQALTGRMVVGRRNADGSANLSGYNLPVERVARASARIGALAKAAKVAGDTRPIDHLRADLFLGMTDGSYLGLGDEEILALLANGRLTDSAESSGAQADGGSCGGWTGDGGTCTKHPGGQDIADAPEPADTPEPASAPDLADAPAGPGAHDGCVASDDATPPVSPTRRRDGVELRAALSTLLGRDRRPGELVGWGPVHAELARDLAATLAGTGKGPGQSGRAPSDRAPSDRAPFDRAQWRYVLTDDGGYFAFTGLLGARPAGLAGARPAGRSTGRCADIVELAVRRSDLPGLVQAVAGGAYPGWAPVLAELVRRAAAHEAEQADERSGTDNPVRRLPGAALRRHLEARDRRCRGVGCRVPAAGADIDHTRDYAAGGETSAINLGPMCRHDHRLKHEGSWHLAQPEAGVFVWTSRLGRRYVVRPAPVIEELPEPIVGDTPLRPVWVPPDYGEDRPILADPEPEPERGPPPTPAVIERDDAEPPF